MCYNQALQDVQTSIDLQEEPVSKVWHDANEEQPEEYRTVVVWNPSIMAGEVLTRCAEVYKGRIWAYIEDLLNLSNVERTVKDWKEPASEDLEQTSKEYALNNTPYDDCAEEMQEAFKAGAKWKKEQLMSEAIEGDITFDYYGDDDKTYGCIAHNSFCLEDFGLKDRDKVKVIVIKED